MMESTSETQRTSSILATEDQRYKIKLIMLIVMQAIISGFKFKLHNNIESDVGVDNFVVNFQHVLCGGPMSKTVILQIMNVICPQKNKILFKNFLDSNDKQSFSKYFQSYQRIHNNKNNFGINMESAYFIIYSNTDFEDSVSDYLEECETNPVLDILLSSNNTTCAFRIKLNKRKYFLPFITKHKDLYESALVFLENIIFLIKQGSDSDIETQIKQCIELRFDEHNKCDIDKNYEESYKSYQEYCLMKDNIQYLTEINDYFLKHSSSLIQDYLNSIKIKLNRDIENKQIKYSEECLYKFAKDLYQFRCIEMKTIQGATLLAIAKILQVFISFVSNAVMFQDTNMIEKYGEKILCNFQHSKTLNVIVIMASDSSNITVQYLSKFFEIVIKSYNKTVIIIHDTKMTFTEGWSFAISFEDIITFQDLSAECQRYILLKKINFNGKTINIQQLYGKNIERYLNKNVLTELLLKNNITIAKFNNEIRLIKNYIPRKFQHYYINTSILHKFTKDFLIILVNIRDLKKSTFFRGIDTIFYPNPVNGRENLYLVLDNQDPEIAFNSICKKMINENIHMLRYDNNKLKWVKSKGTLTFIREHLTEVNSLSEEDIVKYCNDNNLIVISDNSGTGKSTVLKSLVNLVHEYFPELWILKINLNDIIKLLYNMKNLLNYQTAMNIIISTIKLTSEFERMTLLNMISLGQIAIFLDGLDDINIEYEATIVILVNILRQNNIRQIYLTSSLHMREYIEDNLRIIANNFIDITYDEQCSYIHKTWSKNNKSNSEIIKNDSEVFIKKINTLSNHQDIEICGIPLQIYMLSEIYYEYNKVQISDITENNLILLLESFIKYKIQDYVTKNNIQCTFPVEYNKHIKNEIICHQLLALDVLFKEDELHILLDKDQQEQLKQLKQNKQEIKKFGIIEDITLTTIKFIHRIFAEFLVASFICGLIEHGNSDLFKDFLVGIILIEKRFYFIRKFMNSMLLNKKSDQEIITLRRLSKRLAYGLLGLKIKVNPLHIAAKENNLNLIKYLISSMKQNTICTKRILNNYVDNSTLFQILIASSSHEDLPIYLEIIQYIMSYGAKRKGILTHGKTFLHLSAGNKYLMQYLIQFDNKNINKRNIKTGNTALHEAIKFGNNECVKILIKYNIDINIRNFSGESALYLAISLGNLDIVKCLLENGAYVNNTNYNKESVLFLAILAQHVELFEYLLIHGADVNSKNRDGEALLHLAARQDNYDMLKCLVHYGANINIKNLHGVSVLHLVALKGDIDVFKLLLDNGARLNDKDNAGDSILHWAAEEGHLDIIKLLVRYGADVNDKNNDGNSPMYLATLKGHIASLLFMLDQSFDLKTCELYPLLHISSRHGHIDIVNYLLEYYLNVNELNNSEKSAMHLAAEGGHVEIIRSLFRHGADVNVQNKINQSPLHLASKKGHLDAVRFLLKFGANINLQNKKGKSPIHLAAERGHKNIVNYLSKNGANVNTQDKNGNFFLHIAAKRGWLDIVSCLITNGADVNVKSTDKFSMLHWSAERGYYDIFKCLIDNGADVNVKDIYGFPILHRCTMMNQILEVKYLLNNGADMNLKVSGGYTVLHLAAERGYLRIVKILVQNGADINIKNKSEETVLRCAKLSSQTDVVIYLIDNGAKLY